MSSLLVYSSAVSGGGCVSQLALMSEFFDARESLNMPTKPNLCTAASGGNVATYVAMAGQFTSRGIYRVSSMLESDIFARSWWPNRLSWLPSPLLGLFSGGLYRVGYGTDALFSRLFSSPSVCQTEIWTGTFNKTTGRSQFFCNLDSREALISPAMFNSNRVFYSLDSPIYASGDLNLISKYSLASASIPLFIEDQVINGNHYSDGGVAFASTLSPLSHHIYTLLTSSSSVIRDFVIDKINCDDLVSKSLNPMSLILTEIPKPPSLFTKLELICFGCYDMENYSKVGSSYKDDAEVTLNMLIHSSSIADRSQCLRLLERLAESSQIEYRHIKSANLNSLRDCLSNLSSVKHYLLYIYPEGCPLVSITCFTPEEFKSMILQVRQSYSFHVWWCL